MHMGSLSTLQILQVQSHGFTQLAKACVGIWWPEGEAEIQYVNQDWHVYLG